MIEERNAGIGIVPAEMKSCDGHKRSLIDLAARMDEFLDSIGSRFVSILDECEHAVAEQASLRHKATELQQERSDWERQRQNEIARIRVECEQLADAWKRVEEADRDRLSGIDGQANQCPTQAGNQPVVDSPTERMRGERTAEGPLIEVNAPVSRPAHPVVELSPVSILMQFQQLKRDIRNHAQRKS